VHSLNVDSSAVVAVMNPAGAQKNSNCKSLSKVDANTKLIQ
jgi:hypothetical protein